MMARIFVDIKSNYVPWIIVQKGLQGCMHCTCDGSCKLGHTNGQWRYGEEAVRNVRKPGC